MNDLAFGLLGDEAGQARQHPEDDQQDPQQQGEISCLHVTQGADRVPPGVHHDAGPNQG